MHFWATLIVSRKLVVNNYHLLYTTRSLINAFYSDIGRSNVNKTDEVMTIDELVLYLKIPKSTLYKLVREGEIPSQKIGRHLRFRKERIDRWLDQKQEGK